MHLDTADGVTSTSTEYVPVKRGFGLFEKCASVTAGLVGGIVAALIINAVYDPDPVSPLGLRGVAIAILLAFEATLIAGLKDWANRRARVVEQRIKAAMQHETFLVRQDQEAIRQQVAYLRSEIHALFMRLPEKIEAYGDARDAEGEDRAVRRLASASGTDGRPIGVAPVSYINSAHHRN